MFKSKHKRQDSSTRVDESNEPKIVKAQAIEFQMGEKVLVEHIITGIKIGDDGEPIYDLRPSPDKVSSFTTPYYAFRFLERKQSSIRRTSIDGEYRTPGNET